MSCAHLDKYTCLLSGELGSDLHEVWSWHFGFWTFITVASLDAISVECIELLRWSPLLGSLTLIKVQPSSGIFPVSKTRISCPHLHSLELSSIYKEFVVAQFLDSMCLPALEKLIHYYCPLSLDSMMTIVGCSLCLEEFRISKRAMFTKRFITCFFTYHPSRSCNFGSSSSVRL